MKGSNSFTWTKVLLASALVPPVGIVMWWMRPWTGGGISRVVGFIGRVAVSGALVILTLFYLIQLNVLHMELSGAGWQPIFSLRDPKKDQEALEKHRAAQPGGVPASPNVPPTASTGTSEPAPSTKGEGSPAEVEAKPVSAPVAGGPAWTDFRGPNRAGIYTGGPILLAWPSEGLKPLWRQPIGGGYASFVIANGKAYTIEQRREQEVVAAYDVATGRELWKNGWDAHFSEFMGGDGPRATPTWHEGKLYALGATGEFRCYNAESGKVLWQKNILSDNGAANIMWGMANSPLVVDDKVIVTPGGRGRSVVAYNKRSGERIWGALDDQAAYTSPVVVTIAGQRQLLVVTAKRVVGMTVEDGTLLWEYPWTTMYEINSAQPIVTDSNHVFISAGYGHGSALLEISKDDNGFTARAAWENKNLKNRFNSSVLHQGFIYGFDEGIFACIDARTGERKWKGGRYGYGQVLLAGDHLIVLAEDGDLVLLKAAPDAHKEMARFSAIEGKTWNHPAIEGNVLLVRNAREMAAFNLAP
jgi:outer membrane protein assembly factor BamB